MYFLLAGMMRTRGNCRRLKTLGTSVRYGKDNSGCSVHGSAALYQLLIAMDWGGGINVYGWNVNLSVTLCPSELPSTIYSNQGHVVLHCAPYLFPKVWRREYGPCAAVDGRRGNPRRRCYT